MDTRGIVEISVSGGGHSEPFAGSIGVMIYLEVVLVRVSERTGPPGGGLGGRVISPPRARRPSNKIRSVEGVTSIIIFLISS